MNFNIRFLAILAASACLADCSLSNHPLEVHPASGKLAGAHPTMVEAIGLAKQTAQQNGVRLGDYMEPKATYISTPTDKYWAVAFQEKGKPRPGDTFFVLIDDQTREARFVPGR